MSKSIKQLSFLLHTNMYVLFILSCIILSKSTFAQPINFDPVYYNITTETGLPSLETYSVKQDSKGFIWICSDGGVSRYDGFEFKNFTTSDGLTDNVVFDIYEDFKGRIWFLTYNSLLCFYENGVIKPYKFNHLIEPIVKNKSIVSRSFSIDKNENIYYDLYNCGIVKIDKFGKLKQLIERSGNFNVTKVNNEVYISRNLASMTLVQFNTDKGKLILKKNGKANELDTLNVSSHFSAPKGNDNLNANYFLFDDNIFEFSSKNKIYSSAGLLHFIVRDSVFWVCTTTGLKKGELVNGTISITKTYLPDCSVSNVTFLDDGSMCVSTLNSGVYLFNSFNLLFAGKSSGLINPDIIHIRKYNNNILLGSLDFLQNITCGESFNYKKKYFGNVRFESARNQLLISNSIFKDLVKIKDNVFGAPWSSSIVAADSMIYIISLGTVFVFNANDKSIKKNYNGYLNNIKVGLQFLNKLAINDKNELIISSKNELFILKGDQLVPIQLPLKHRIDINSLNFHEKWGLVIGTSGNGIILLKNKRIRFITSKSGLLSDIVNTIEIAKDGKIFVGSPNGMSIIKPDGEIGVFGRNQSIIGMDINTIYLDDESVLIGTKLGLFKLSKSCINKCFERVKPAKVNLSGVEFDNESVGLSKKITFPHESTLLQLNFQVLQFGNWFSKQYQYKIGEDGNWVYIESPSISLYRPVGDFKVFIRYMDAQYKWSIPILLCDVNVAVPFWKRWYFWTIIGFGSLIILFLFYQRSQRRIHDKLIYQSQMLSLEQQMQNARMNPHFVFNVLNSIHSYVLNQELEKADVYLMKFSKLMREILMSTKEGVIKIEEEVSILKKYIELEQLRHQNSFEFNFTENEVNGKLSIPSMMIQPFVENAIIYSDKKSQSKSFIEMSFKCVNESCFQVSIINSGIPSNEDFLKMQTSTTTNAIGITRKRLMYYNQLLQSTKFGVEIKIIDGISTAIILNIPVIKN